MSRHRHVRHLVHVIANQWTLVFAALICGISGGIMPGQARASEPETGRNVAMGIRMGDGHGKYIRVTMTTGNGRFNKTYSTVFSPTVNRGLQQVSNTNVSGKTNTQVGFCRKKHRVCKISQRLLSGR